MTLFLLDALGNATFKPVEIQNPNQISYSLGEKFIIDDYEILENFTGSITDRRYQQKRRGSGDLEVTNYTVVPFDTKDTTTVFQYWIGFRNQIVLDRSETNRFYHVEDSIENLVDSMIINFSPENNTLFSLSQPGSETAHFRKAVEASASLDDIIRLQLSL